MKTMKSLVSLVLAMAMLLSFVVVPAAAETTSEAVTVELGSYQWKSNSGVENGYGFSMSDDTKAALAETSWFGTVAVAGDYGRWTRATGNVLVDGVETEVNIVIQASQSALFIGNSVKYLTEGHTIVIPKENVFTVNRTYGGTIVDGSQIQFARTYKLTYNAETGNPILGFEVEAKEKVSVELGSYAWMSQSSVENGYGFTMSDDTKTALTNTSWFGATSGGSYGTWTRATGNVLVDGVETEVNIVIQASRSAIFIGNTVKYLTEGHTVEILADAVFTVNRTLGGTLANGGEIRFAENYQLTYDTATSKPVLSVVVEEDPIVTAGVAYFADANNYGDHYYGAFGGVTCEENTVKILANEAGGHIGFRLTKNAIKSMIDAGYKTVEFKMTTAAYEEGNIPTYINAFAFGVYPSTYQSSYTNATVQGTDAYYASGSVLKLDLVELYYNGLTDGLRFILKNNNGGGGANGAPAYVVLSEFQFTKDDVAETPIGQMTLAASYENGENGEFGGVTAVGENGTRILANAKDGVAGFQLKRSAVEKLLTFGVNEMTFTLETAAYNGGAVPAYVVLDAAAADYVVNCETVAAKIDGSKLYFAAGTQITIRLQKLYADMTYTDGLEFVLLNGDTWASGSESAYLTLSGLTFAQKLETLDLDLVTTNGDFTSYYASEGSWLAMTKKSVRAVAEAGFKYVDLTLYDVRSDHILMQDGWEDIIAELKDYADECGVEFRQAHSPGYTTHGSEEWVDTNKRCIDICQMLGIENLVSHTSTAKTEGGSVVNYTKTLFFENNTANYALILPYAAEKGVNILCENATYVSMAYGWSVNTGADMREFVKYVQNTTGYTNIHACWDMGHANCEGDQYLDILALGDEMYGIHFHDNTGSDTHLMPYYGNMDIAAVMRAIKMMGYIGDFTLEADGSSRAGGTYTGPALEGDLDPNTTDCFEQEEILYQIAEYILTEYDCGAPVRNDTDLNKREKVTVELGDYNGMSQSGVENGYAYKASDATKAALAETSWFGYTSGGSYGQWTRATGMILVDGVETEVNIVIKSSNMDVNIANTVAYLAEGKTVIIPKNNIFTVNRTYGGTLDNGGQIQFAENYKLTYNASTSRPVLSVATATVVDGTEYLSMHAAVNAAVESGKTVTLHGNVADEAVTLEENETLALELNGFTATVNGGTLTLTDSTTDDGTVGGKVYGDFAVTSRVSQNGVIRYVILDGEDANGAYKTANAVRVKVSGVNIRPGKAGIYYATDVKFNQNVANAGAIYGVALSLEDTPGADFATEVTQQYPNQWTKFTAATGADFSDKGTSTLISYIMKSDLSADKNTERGTMDIFANAYVKIQVGNEVVTIMMENTAEVAYSLQSVMKALDTKYAAELQAYAAGTGELSETARKAVAFYKDWQTVMATWELDNMAAAAAVA